MTKIQTINIENLSVVAVGRKDGFEIIDCGKIKVVAADRNEYITHVVKVKRGLYENIIDIPLDISYCESALKIHIRKAIGSIMEAEKQGLNIIVKREIFGSTPEYVKDILSHKSPILEAFND